MGWIASLSNGQTVFEAQPKPGQMSSWQQLLAWLRENPDVRISQMQLQQAGRTLVAIPKAAGYVQCYEMHKNMQSGAEQHYQGIGSIVGDQVFMTWINANGNVWQDLRPLSELRVHSTLPNHEVV
jgi:hypothetical protein